MKQIRSIEFPWLKPDSLKRVTWLLVGLIILVTAAFALTYYLDRYVHFGDNSPTELAIERLEKQVDTNPDNVEMRSALAALYLDTGRYDEAAGQAQKALLNSPENEDALFVLGLALTEMGNLAEATHPLLEFSNIRAAQPMAASDQSLQTALYYLGQNYRVIGQPDDAAVALNAALKINRTDADAMYQLGLVYLDQDKPESAIDQFMNAIRFVPNFHEVYKSLAIAYRQAGMNSYLAFAEGGMAFSLQEYDQAVELLSIAVENTQHFGPVYMLLGLTFEEMGDLESAQANLEFALQFSPDDFATQNALRRVESNIAAGSTSP